MNAPWLTRRVALAVLVMSAVGGPHGREASDPITEWSVAASNLVAASGMDPLRAPITFALLHLAMYDAVTTVVAEGSPYAVRPHVTRPASAEAAAIEAGYHILRVEFPTLTAQVNETHQWLSSLVPDSLARQNGARVGALVARALLELRSNDGRNSATPYDPGTGPGVWIPTPPGLLPATTAFLAKVTPFLLDSPARFRPSGPPRLRSERWANEYAEVRRLGGRDSTARTPGQTATALFWEPLAGTVWPASIRRLAREEALDLPRSATFQAAAFAAFADSLIACWDAKFHFNFWRPVTAVRAGDVDNNRGTEPDSTWEPLAITPNFPEYPSGHACATAAVAHTIEAFLGPDVLIPTRNVVTGEERFYRGAAEVSDEVIEARMLLGVHFRSADEDGADIGRRIARLAGRQFPASRR
jgi:hypothetical protein